VKILKTLQDQYYAVIPLKQRFSVLNFIGSLLKTSENMEQVKKGRLGEGVEILKHRTSGEGMGEDGEGQQN
jgi:hypothetical protein